MLAPEFVESLDAKFAVAPNAAQDKIADLPYMPVRHVDLLAMSRSLDEFNFRQYLDASREIRAVSKKQ